MHILKGQQRFSVVTILISLLCVALHLLNNGYYFLVSDQLNYIPSVLKYNDPSLYVNDYYINQMKITGGISIWIPVMAWLSKFVPLHILFITLHLISAALFFLSLISLAKQFCVDQKWALLAPLFFIVSKPILGASLVSFDSYFHVRSFVFPLLVYALSFYFSGQDRRAVIATAMAFLVHPIMTLPLISILGCFYLFQAYKESSSYYVINVIILTIGGVPFLLKTLFKQGGESFFSPATAHWYSVVVDRVPGVFINNWHPGYVILLLSFLVIVGLFFFLPGFFLKQSVRTRYGVLVFGLIFFILCGVLATEVFLTRIGVVSLYLRVSIYFVYLIPILYLAMINKVERQNDLGLSLLLVTGFVLYNWTEPTFDYLFVGLLIMLLVMLKVYQFIIDTKFLFITYCVMFVIVFLCAVQSILLYPIQGIASNFWALISSKTILFLLILMMVVWSVKFIARNSDAKIVGLFMCNRSYILLLVMMLFTSLKGLNSSSIIRLSEGNLQSSSKIGLLDWIKLNTGKDDLFMTSTSNAWFRAQSKRSAFINNKDGGPSILSSSFAKTWSTRMAESDAIYSSTVSEKFLCDVTQKNSIKYVLFSANQKVDQTLQFAFENDGYKVYDTQNCVMTD